MIKYNIDPIFYMALWLPYPISSSLLLYGSSLSSEKVNSRSVDNSYGIISKLARGSRILYKSDILAGNLT